MGEEQNGGRYARRPVIAQRRMTEIDERTVEFSVKDKYSRKIVQIRCSLENLIDLWAQHILKHYKLALFFASTRSSCRPKRSKFVLSFETSFCFSLDPRKIRCDKTRVSVMKKVLSPIKGRQHFSQWRVFLRFSITPASQSLLQCQESQAEIDLSGRRCGSRDQLRPSRCCWDSRDHNGR
jgi:hypothetical protein